MNQPPHKKDTPEEERTSTTDETPAALLEKALQVCMVLARKVAGRHDNQATTNVEDNNNTNQANATDDPPAETEDFHPQPAVIRSASPIQEAALACMPGAYDVPGPSDPTATTTDTADADYVDPLHVRVDDAEEERNPDSAMATIDIEGEDQQQPTDQQTNIVSAYRVTEVEPEPAIIATPFKDNRLRSFLYGVLASAVVIALIVGLSVGLTIGSKEEQQTDDSLGRLVSSLNVTGSRRGSFLEASRYSRTENGREIITTIGSAAGYWCVVVPCMQGGCNLFNYYEPGCCVGDNCSLSDKCGSFCPKDACHPSFDGCKDVSCYECERGPNGEEIYRLQTDTCNWNCLRTGVATGLNDKDDSITRIYKWAIVCGYVVWGGNEWLNVAPGEYACAAYRIGDGITKTVSIAIPCQLIQLAECGCAPDDVHTLGLFPPPDKPCKTKHDCPYLCGDAGEEQAKTLCEAFPGIEWWEGENPLYTSLFMHSLENYWFDKNLTIEINIYGE